MDLNWTVTQSDLHMKKTTLSSGAENETKAVEGGAMAVAWIKVMAVYKLKTHSGCKAICLGDRWVWG